MVLLKIGTSEGNLAGVASVRMGRHRVPRTSDGCHGRGVLFMLDADVLKSLAERIFLTESLMMDSVKIILRKGLGVARGKKKGLD